MEMIIALVLAYFFILGALKTFIRNPVWAIVLFIFVTPIWVLWACIEIITPEVED